MCTPRRLSELTTHGGTFDDPKAAHWFPGRCTMRRASRVASILDVPPAIRLALRELSEEGTKVMGLAPKLLLAFAIFTLATISAGRRQADAQSPYCQVGSGYYNAAYCAQLGGSGYSQYCQVGTATYNAALCAQYGGSGYSQYCQVGSGYYNAALCAQYGGATYSQYCQVGTATYNATLCAQYGGSTASAYCQVGTTTYNATLCAQYGGSTYGAYCQAGTVTYNATLCAQYGGGQAGAIVLRANASGLDCGGKAAVTVSVPTLSGSPVPDGTSVLLTATLGTISPTQATTLGGLVQATFAAPSTGSGTATITASVGSVTSSINVALNCVPAAAPAPAQVAPAAVAPVTVPSPAPVAPAASIPIQPPSTGDGGLLSDERGASQRAGAAAVLALMLFTFGAFTLRRAHCG